MSKKFAEYSKFDLSNVNKEVLKKWQDGDIFHKSLEIREGYPSFVFYEGPPSANGMPVFTTLLPVRLRTFSAVTRP